MKHLLTHWHPLVLSKKLRNKPLAVKICGEQLVAFRDSQGSAVVLADRCPHRQAPLHLGCVKGDRIVCPYHGWQFDQDGQAAIPNGQKGSRSAESYRVLERFGIVWIQALESEEAFPEFDVSAYRSVKNGSRSYEANVPFQLFVDNMLELEHSPTVHGMFGFDIDEIANVQHDAIFEEGRVNVTFTGSQRALPSYFEFGTGVRGGDRYSLNIDLRFKPVHAVYTNHWVDSKSDSQRPFKMRYVIFFVPIDEHSCRQFTIAHAADSKLDQMHLQRVFDMVMVLLTDLEFTRDVRLLNRLGAKADDFAHYQLGKFDRPLLESRKRIDALYLKPVAS